MLRGEVGCESGVPAQSIHNEGPRKGGPFVSFCCSA
jgi:transcriptional regulator with PAS, ATPase and Fis domain